MCRTVLRITQSVHTMLGRPPIQKRRNGNRRRTLWSLRVNRAKLFVCTKLASADRTFFGPWFHRACDKRITRLLSYIHHTGNCRQYCHVGIEASDWKKSLFQNADFARDLYIMRSLVQFRKPSFCANFMDMHETDSRVTLPHISWGDFFGRWPENGRITWFFHSGILWLAFQNSHVRPARRNPSLQLKPKTFKSAQESIDYVPPNVDRICTWVKKVWSCANQTLNNSKQCLRIQWNFIVAKSGTQNPGKKIPVGQPIGQWLRTEVRVFSDRFVCGKQQGLSESDMDDKSIWNVGLVDMRGHLRYHGQTGASSIGTFLQATPRSKSREKFRLSWDPLDFRDRIIFMPMFNDIEY